MWEIQLLKRHHALGLGHPILVAAALSMPRLSRGCQAEAPKLPKLLEVPAIATIAKLFLQPFFKAPLAEGSWR